MISARPTGRPFHRAAVVMSIGTMKAQRSGAIRSRRATATLCDANCVTSAVERTIVQRPRNGLDSSWTYSLCTPSDMVWAIATTSSITRVSAQIWVVFEDSAIMRVMIATVNRGRNCQIRQPRAEKVTGKLETRGLVAAIAAFCQICGATRGFEYDSPT
jgi:hypothetical protein